MRFVLHLINARENLLLGIGSANVSSRADQAGVKGTVLMVVDELFNRERLRLWIDAGSPKGKSDITVKKFP